MDNQVYTVYEITPSINEILINTIIGNKKISILPTPTPFIVIYTDIIEPVRYGSQNLQILDILPFGETRLHERKLNNLSYKTLSKNNIGDISIQIQNSSFKLLNNYSESIILCLHFRKKVYIENKI